MSVIHIYPPTFDLHKLNIVKQNDKLIYLTGLTFTKTRERNLTIICYYD